MANSFLIPFNNDPTNTVQTSTSYTVPAGKYAIINVCLSVHAGPVNEPLVTIGASQTASYGGNSDSDSVSLNLILKAGQVLTKVETVASASAATSISSGTEIISITSDSIASVLIDGTTVGTISARGASFISVSGDPVIRTINVSGSSSVKWNASEYKSIT